MLEEDFDGEAFAAEVNALLSHKTDRIKNFESLGDEAYQIESETFLNLYGRDEIDIDLSYSNDISDQVLIMSFQFNTNCPQFHYEEFTVNDYDPSEVVDFLIEMYDDFLEHVYKDDKNDLLKFSKDDMKYMLEKHPNDEFIKSVASGSKYKLFDSFINEHNDGEFAEWFTDQVSEELDKDFMTYIHHYAGTDYMVSSEEYESMFGDSLYVGLEKDEDDDVKITFDSNSDGTIQETVPAEPFYVAQTLNSMFKDWLIKMFKEDNSLILKMGQNSLDFIEQEFPDQDIDNLIKSIKGGQKYKLFDSFINEQNVDTIITGSRLDTIARAVEPHLDKKLIKWFMKWSSSKDEIKAHNNSHDNIYEYVPENPQPGTMYSPYSGIIIELYDHVEKGYEQFHYYKVVFDVENKDFEPLSTYTEDTSHLTVANVIEDLMRQRLVQLYEKYNEDKLHLFSAYDLRYLKHKFPNDKRIDNIITSLEGGEKYKVFDNFLSAEEEESGEVETPQLPIGDWKVRDNGEDMIDDAHEFIYDIQEALGDKYGKLEVIARAPYEVFAKILDLVTNEYIHIDISIANPGEDHRYLKVEFDTKNEDVYPVESLTTADSEVEVAEILKNNLNDLYQEHLKNNDDIRHKDADNLRRLVSILPTYDKAKNLLNSVEGGEKFKVLDFYNYVNESRKEREEEEKSDIEDDDPLFDALIPYFNDELDKIFKDSGIEAGEEYNMYVKKAEDSMIIKIGAVTTVSRGADIPERVEKLRDVADKLENFVKVMTKYPFLTATIERQFPGGSKLKFKAKISDLMKIDKIKNAYDSHQGGKKYKLFMQRDEEV